MPTVDENKSVWEDRYKWSDAGDEWSDKWGGVSMQWHGTILPRIQPFLPAHTILEIAPGFGRWTDFLKNYCTDLIVVDISEKCINKCKDRFADCSHINYFVNDGSSLDMIADNSIDFIFSFDSLVHAEDTVISAYVSQFERKLKENGAAFIHHSNLGNYSHYIDWQSKIPVVSRLLRILTKLGILDNIRRQWRAPSMTAKKCSAMQKKIICNALVRN